MAKRDRIEFDIKGPVTCEDGILAVGCLKAQLGIRVTHSEAAVEWHGMTFAEKMHTLAVHYSSCRDPKHELPEFFENFAPMSETVH